MKCGSYGVAVSLLQVQGGFFGDCITIFEKSLSCIRKLTPFGCWTPDPTQKQVLSRFRGFYFEVRALKKIEDRNDVRTELSDVHWSNCLLFFCSIQIYEGSSLMVRVGEFLAILTLSRAKKHSLVHYQKWTSPTEPSRVAFGRDQGLSLSLLWLRYSSPHKHAHNRSKSLTTHSRGLTQYKCTALDLKPLIAFLLCLFPLVTDLYDLTPVTLSPTTR